MTVSQLWLTGLLVAMYFNVLEALTKNWLTYEAAFGFVIVAITGFMGLHAVRRLQSNEVELRPGLVAGTLITSGGCVLYILGHAASTLVLQQIALLVTLFGLAWLLFGRQFVRGFWVPLGYLLFTLPLPEKLLLSQSESLQNAAAWIAAALLSLTSMPVVYHGQVLELPHITLEVARECSGVNHIIALTSLAIPMAFLSGAPRLHKVFIAVVAFFLGIVLNGVRIAMIGWWSVGHKELHGPVSTLFVSFIFFAGLAILSLLTHGYWRSGRRSPPATGGVPVGPLRVCPDGQRAAIVLATVLLLVTWAVVRFRVSQPVSLAAPSAAFPAVIAGWVGVDAPGVFLAVTQVAPDVLVERRYSNSAGQVYDLYVGYYEQQSQEHEAVSAELNRFHESAVQLALGDGIAVNRAFQRTAAGSAAVYFWYDIDGRILSSRYRAKLSTAWDWLSKSRTNGALVLIVSESRPSEPGSVGDTQDTDLQFLKVALPVIRDFLKPYYVGHSSVYIRPECLAALRTESSWK